MVTLSSLSDLWNRLSIGELDIQQVSGDILADCGVDACDLTLSDIEGLFLGSKSTPWKQLAWSLDEALASYVCYDLSNREFGNAVIAACFLSEAISRGYGDWQFSFDKMISLICRNMNKGDYEFRLEYFRIISGSGGAGE